MPAEFAMPTEIRRLDKTGVEVSWGDGHRSEYSNHELRRQCPCAVCRVRPPRSLPVVGPGTQELYPTRIEVVGRYAVTIHWSDGHDSGIYSYRTLRRLCPCVQCQASAPGVPGPGPSATAPDAAAKETTSR